MGRSDNGAMALIRFEEVLPRFLGDGWVCAPGCRLDQGEVPAAVQARYANKAGKPLNLEKEKVFIMDIFIKGRCIEQQQQQQQQQQKEALKRACLGTRQRDCDAREQGFRMRISADPTAVAGFVLTDESGRRLLPMECWEAAIQSAIAKVDTEAAAYSGQGSPRVWPTLGFCRR
ncbi:hypothetical protein WJX72_001462 [[Myrmecia] bisecta]|uniref:Uncharacterized protein n=1 Tax=[Myrmecia] bisecta TaxID=41462 RepID=A0AAW1PBS0_9CHLO